MKEIATAFEHQPLSEVEVLSEQGRIDRRLKIQLAVLFTIGAIPCTGLLATIVMHSWWPDAWAYLFLPLMVVFFLAAELMAPLKTAAKDRVKLDELSADQNAILVGIAELQPEVAAIWRRWSNAGLTVRVRDFEAILGYSEALTEHEAALDVAARRTRLLTANDSTTSIDL